MAKLRRKKYAKDTALRPNDLKYRRKGFHDGAYAELMYYEVRGFDEAIGYLMIRRGQGSAFTSRNVSFFGEETIEKLYKTVPPEFIKLVETNVEVRGLPPDENGIPRPKYFYHFTVEKIAIQEDPDYLESDDLTEQARERYEWELHEKARKIELKKENALKREKAEKINEEIDEATLIKDIGSINWSDL